MIFHLKAPPISNFSSYSNIEPIIFFSHLLIPAKTRYWPIKLEMAGLVWVLRKTRYLVEAVETLIVVHTDHEASLGITTWTTLSTSSTEKLNFRLVCASNYVSYFLLVIKYKSDKRHIILDTFSRLKAKRKNLLENQKEDELDVLFTITLIEMSKEFWKKLI